MNNTLKKKLDVVVAWSVLATSVLFVLFYVSSALTTFTKTNDLPQYYAAASLAASGHACDIYKKEGAAYPLFQEEHRQFPNMGERAGVMLFLPPPAVPLLLPLSLVAPAAAPYVWTIGLAVSLVVGSLLLLRVFYPMGVIGTCWSLALILLSGPAIDALRIGQLAPVLLLALCAFIQGERRQRPAIAGLALSLFVLKPQQIIPLIIYMVGARRFRELLWLCLAVGLYLAISLVIFGPCGFSDYIQLLTAADSFAMMSASLTPTLRGQLLRFDETAHWATLVGILAMGLAVLAIWLLGRRWRFEAHWLEIGLLGAMPLGLVFSLHCHNYDLLLLVPGLVALVHGDLWHRIGAGTKFWLTGLLLVFLTPFYQEIYYGHIVPASAQPLQLNLLFVALAMFAFWAFRSVWCRQPDRMSDI